MCCGGNSQPLRVQVIAPPSSNQRVQLKPPSTMKVYKSTSNVQQPVTQAVRKVENEPCPLCRHPVMVARVSGRPRKQCTNFSCRHIIQ